jgi:uncharacterized protein YndB with AHSA1/START domain
MRRTPTAPADSGGTREAVRLDAVYPHPPERVWRALTDPAEVARWLPSGDFRPRLGHRFTLRDGRRGLVRAEVVALEHARRLGYTWRRPGADEPPSLVTWTLQPVDGGAATRVRVTHTGLQASAAGTFWAGAPRRLARALRPVLMPPPMRRPAPLELTRSLR